MKKAGLTIMVLMAILMITFTIVFYHSTTDNVVDSGGFWAYMYGKVSVPWPTYSAGVVFLMGLTMYISSWEQKAQRYN
ncbi:hypothetical protein [Mucilaginibacter sp.]